ncbi:hypothetical protein [Agromyces aureus]|uniref:hypothetical protein n=1 Tax=Agromyces aureus TaxID=453304 RepID=UPI00126010FF|nr:hypothetical protein [Agromyces aureus]
MTSQPQSQPEPQQSPYAPRSEHPDSPATATAAPAAPTRSALALVSFIAGLTVVLLGVLVTLLYPLIFISQPMSTGVVVVVQTGSGILTALVALVAVVTGTIALLKRGGASKTLAAAGTALGGAAIVQLLAGLVQSGLFQLVV